MDVAIDKLLSEGTMKASEIAKKLGVSKTEVNQFLYRNLDRFTVNENYIWSRRTSDTLLIKFEDEKWIDCKCLEDVLSRCGPLRDPQFLNIVIEFPEAGRLMLEASARLLALCNQLAALGKSVTLDFKQCISVLTWLDRVGIFQALDDRIIVSPYRPTEGRSKKYSGNSDALVELVPISPGIDNSPLAIKLTKLFVSHTDKSYEVLAGTLFGELISNVTEHSDSPISGFAALQVYKPNRKKIQTVVSDSGLGIAQTLRPALKEHYPRLHSQLQEDTIDNNIELVKLAVSQGGISRFGKERGTGFQVTAKQAVKFDYTLAVRQDTYEVVLDYQNGELVKETRLKNLVPIDGTHIGLDFYVD